MEQLFTIIFFSVWAGLIVLGLNPGIGVRVGLWLQNRVDPVQPPAEAEKEHPNRLDRWV